MYNLLRTSTSTSDNIIWDSSGAHLTLMVDRRPLDYMNDFRDRLGTQTETVKAKPEL